jgi:DNA-binding CsgD family transcriptional regulator/PAS domain-containing protein
LPIPATLNQLIHAIYHGVMEDTPWSSFLQQAQQLFDTDMAVLMVVPGNQLGNKVFVNHLAAPLLQQTDLSHGWTAQDPFKAIRHDSPVRLTDLHSSPAISESGDFYQQLQQQGLQHCLAINIATDDSPDLLLKLRLARSADKDNFSELDCELLADMVTHIKLALRYFDQMAIQHIERNAFADAINQFMLGTLLLDRSGKIVASNRVARDSIEHYELLSIQNGCLMIADKNSNRQLYQALDTIDDSGNRDDVIGQTITIGRGSALTLGLIIRPIRPEDALAYPVHAHAVVFISNTQGTRKISAATLKDLFGFTDSESKVAAYLANGNTLTEAAAALSVSINTAKTHARNIYEKTGVNKQTKFIQLVSNSVARVS